MDDPHVGDEGGNGHQLLPRERAADRGQRRQVGPELAAHDREREIRGAGHEGEAEPAGGPHPDHLVIEDVWRHPDQLELPPPLARQLCRRRTGSNA